MKIIAKALCFQIWYNTRAGVRVCVNVFLFVQLLGSRFNFKLLCYRPIIDFISFTAFNWNSFFIWWESFSIIFVNYFYLFFFSEFQFCAIQFLFAPFFFSPISGRKICKKRLCGRPKKKEMSNYKSIYYVFHE